MNSPRITLAAATGLVMSLMLVSGAASAEKYLKGRFTGEEMLKYCKATVNEPVRDFERGVCIGFIDGFLAGHHAAGLWHALHHREESINDVFGQLCVPTSANRTELAELFVKYLEARPNKREWNAGTLLEAALSAAYPCDDTN
jgi:hypothetical protein